MRRSVRMAMTAVAVAVVGALGVACTPSTHPQAHPRHSTKSAPAPTYLPLTGQRVDSLPANPAVSIKIPADKHARPQTGLNQADNVWVELVEGGETRYDAIFYSHLPTNVGPVRSVRPVDGPINAPLHGVLLCSGGQDQFLQQVGGQVGALLTEATAGRVTHRIKERKIPFNLYASAVDAASAPKAAGLRPPAKQWDFAAKGQRPSALVGPQSAGFEVLYPAATSRWTWSGSRWQRFERQVPVMDADGGQVQADNVVVLAVQTNKTPYVDPVGAPVVDTVLTGSGPAKVATGGHVIDATWHKDAIDSRVRLTDSAGKTVTLAPGNIWIEAVPQRAQWFR